MCPREEKKTSLAYGLEETKDTKENEISEQVVSIHK